MTDYEIATLSRLALLKVANNVGSRFVAAEKTLCGRASDAAAAIRSGDSGNLVAKSMIEWAEEQMR